jgi:hypothetical protein
MVATTPPTSYVFRMDGWRPETLPAKRLAQYLERLAALLGEPEGVHFVKIRAGSAKQYLRVDPAVASTVFARLTGQGVADQGETTAIRRDINKMLMDDQSTGYLKAEPGAKIISFPGRKTPIAEEIAVHEAGELEGTVIRVGGKTERAIPVTLDNGAGEYFRCSATKETAKRLAALLFEGQVRVSGSGKWTRGSDGVWHLQSFDIKDFARLDDGSLSAVVQDMRKVEGSGWNAVPDAQAELRKLREY